jgi:hypothetical protein
VTTKASSKDRSLKLRTVEDRALQTFGHIASLLHVQHTNPALC